MSPVNSVGGVVLYDAREAKSSLLGPVMLPMMVIIAFLLIRNLRKSNPSRGGDPLVNRAVSALMLFGIVASLISASIPFFQGLSAKRALESGHVSVVQGCVREFDRQVHENEHNLTDTYFSVGGRPFHFNSSPWLPGFHNEANAITAGEGLRVTTTGDTVLRIERAPAACATGAG